MDAQVLPGGKIEIVDDALPVGRVIRVSVSYAVDIREGRDVLDILDEPVPPRAFTSAEEVDAYVRWVRGKTDQDPFQKAV